MRTFQHPLSCHHISVTDATNVAPDLSTDESLP